MPNLKIKEVRQHLRQMSDKELRDEITANKALLFDFRRRQAMRQLENTAAIRNARKQIARALTILKEREIAAKGETK